MAIYHLSSTIISRSQGRSAVACAAYRSGERLHDEKYAKDHDYTKKQDVAYTEILLPENAPTWMQDREQLWNTVESCEKRKDAQLAREIELALPRELTLEQNIALVKEFVYQAYVSQGMVADIGLHLDRAADGEPQPHAHVMLTLREITQEGFGQKARDWNRTEQLLKWREEWANVANRHLALQGHELRIDHRSYEAQGIALEPQYKIGAVVAQTRLARFEDHQRIARENGEKILENPQLVLEAITRQQSTFTHQDLARYVNRHTETAEQFQAVYAKVKASPELVTLGIDTHQRERFTTQAMLTLETGMMARAEQLVGREDHPVRESAKAMAFMSKTLSPEQQAAFVHVLEKGDLKCIVGYAGSGKSYLLGVVREAWEAQGYRVQGATLSGIAAQNLEASSGIESRTLASRLYYWDQGRERLTDQDILVIDEAGMLGSRQMARVLEEAEQQGAKVILVGDPEQLQAIEAGAAFRAISERVGYVELTEIRRQQETWQQEATRELATGRTEEALKRYAAHDHLHDGYESHLRAQQAVIESWNEARLQEPDKTQLMLAYTRKEVAELNTLARSLRHAHGELGEDHVLETARGPRALAENDRIYFLRNERGLGVKNGTLGTIEQIQGKALTIRLEEGEGRPDTASRTVHIHLDQYNHIDHGYAATFHKAQGVTVDRSYVLLSSSMDRHTTYVGASRHRESCDLFYGRERFANEYELAQTLSRERAKDVSLDYHQQPQVFAQHYGLEQDATVKAVEHSRDYQEARERFERDVPHKQRILDRIEARREAKAFQREVERLEQAYHKPTSRHLVQGEEGICRETITAGKSHYAVIEKDYELKLVPYEKGMERYEGRKVQVNLSYDEKQGRERASLDLSRERSLWGRSRGDDFDLSL